MPYHQEDTDFALETNSTFNAKKKGVLVDMPHQHLFGSLERLQKALPSAYSVRIKNGRVTVWGNLSLKDTCRKAVKKHNDLMRAKETVHEMCKADGKQMTIHAKCRQIQRGMTDAEVLQENLPTTTDGTIITAYRRKGKNKTDRHLEGLDTTIKNLLH